RRAAGARRVERRRRTVGYARGTASGHRGSRNWRRWRRGARPHARDTAVWRLSAGFESARRSCIDAGRGRSHCVPGPGAARDAHRSRDRAANELVPTRPHACQSTAVGVHAETRILDSGGGTAVACAEREGTNSRDLRRCSRRRDPRRFPGPGNRRPQRPRTRNEVHRRTRQCPGVHTGTARRAWTDDDTDIEWPYLLEMQRTKTIVLPYPMITEVWKKHINRGMWSSHLYLRQLMDPGIDPPLTGRIAINPWADFNLSGQFVSETWGLISPGMPRTAARIGVHYTHVSIDGEAIQSTQMMDAMIATAFFTSDMEKILDAGAAAVDPRSTMSRIIADGRQWARENPNDWRVTRKLTKDKYCRYGGEDWRDRNGVWLNGAATVAALIHGGGDFARTMRHAFNFGWDAD